jgi:hypothetical protein
MLGCDCLLMQTTSLFDSSSFDIFPPFENVRFAANVPPINAAIGTVSNVASRLCDEAKPGQILISPRVLTKVDNAVKVEPAGEFALKGIRRPLAAYNVVASRT